MIAALQHDGVHNQNQAVEVQNHAMAVQIAPERVSRLE